MFWLDLDCSEYTSINKSIKSWIDQQSFLPNTGSFWNHIDTHSLLTFAQDFQKWLLQKKLPVKSIAVTWGTQPNCCSPHTDTPPARFKLSWPVENCQNTWNRWFRPSHDRVRHVTNALGGKNFNLADLEEITRRETTGPALIDAGQIHDVWCSPEAKFPRIMLQCQLLKEPLSLELIA